MKFIKTTSLFTVVTMAISSVISSTQALAATELENVVTNEGDVNLKRNIQWINNDTLKVDVTIDGVPKKEGIDAILIVDISASMVC